MSKVFENLVENGIKFYSDDLIHWFVNVTLTRKPCVDFKYNLESVISMTPIGSYSIEHNQPEEEVIELSTEIWSTSCDREFLEQVLYILEYDLNNGFPEYYISIHVGDTGYEYVDFDAIEDSEFEDVYRCLRYETAYFTKKELKEGYKSENSKTNKSNK